MGQKYLFFSGIIFLFGFFLHTTNPNRKQDLKRYLDDSGELWLEHQMDNNYFFTVHRLATGNLWKLRETNYTYIGIGGSFFLVSKRQVSISGIF